MQIREPVAADAEAAARMQYAAWVEAYTPLMPPDFWGPATEQRWVDSWVRSFAREGARRSRSRIALHDGAVVGVASAGPGRPNETAGEPVREQELYILYVLESEYGTGLASRLLEAVLPPTEPAQLWVFEANPRARAFYAKHGFRADGARHAFGPEYGNQPEIRMVR